MEKEKSYAVHEKDLEEFLISLGIYDAVLEGKFTRIAFKT
jgi:hypothetical protein